MAAIVGMRMHIGVDADTGQIVAAALTNKEVDDAGFGCKDHRHS